MWSYPGVSEQGDMYHPLVEEGDIACIYTPPRVDRLNGVNSPLNA